MLKKGIIYKSTGIWHLVKSGNIFYKCRIKGKLRLHNSKSTSPVVVGDRVSFILDIENNSQGIIIEVQKRRNHIIRKSVKLSKQFQVIASNIDQIYLIITLNYPITFTQFIDRILVTAEAYRIPLNLVFNKMDIYSSSEKNEIKKLKNIYELIGYKCYKISALNKDSVNKVSKSMKNKVNMIIGHSGVGKSTLINTISPNLMIKTSNISDLHKQGQHTTTYSEMFDLSDKIKIIDTPGIKGFGLVDMDSNEIKNYFPEFKNLNGNCKYNNCLHLNEPNCAVINALNLNKISESRYKSYLNLIDENSTDRIKEMKAVIQRVKKAKVLINNLEERKIDFGLVVLLGIGNSDNEEDADWLLNKVLNIRIFNDEKDIMNLSLIDTNGSIMIISQFTLMASTKKGNRPSYINAANHKHAVPLYNYFIRKTSNFINAPIVTGEFGANMLVSIENDGPVTIVIDSKNKE